MILSSLFSRLADHREARTGVERAIQAGMAACAPLYGMGAWTNRLLHEAGLRPQQRLPAVVLSVGNVTMGGTGKTPFTVWLAGWLRSEGRRPAILSRGYGRDNEDSLVTVHDGRRLRANTREAGDEPVLMGRRLRDVPVVACSNRYEGGQFALRRFAIDTFVLDDGLQHVALKRQGEIVLLDATRPVGHLRLFPRGTLREPLGVLKRAHLIVLTRCDQAPNSRRMARALRRAYPHVPVVRTSFVVRHLRHLFDGKRAPASHLDGKSVVLVCGVGNPASVRKTVEGLGARVVAMKALDDHATPTKQSVLKWDGLRRRAGADAIVVTEKDAVKLMELGRMPEGLYALHTDLRFESAGDRELAERTLRSRLDAGELRGYLT